jgi:hypothetical protein
MPERDEKLSKKHPNLLGVLWVIVILVEYLREGNQGRSFLRVL